MTISTKPKTRTLFSILILSLALILGLSVYSKYRSVPPKINGLILKKPLEIKPFNLMTQDETAFTKQQLHGHWTLVFFGFTHCAVVCPTTMAMLSETYNQLEQQLPKAQLPQVVLISVDPARDSSSRLKEFVESFNPNFIGARADMQDIMALEKQLYLPTALDNPMNHSTKIILFNPKAQVEAYFSSPHTSSKLAEDYKAIVKQ